MCSYKLRNSGQDLCFTSKKKVKVIKNVFSNPFKASLKNKLTLEAEQELPIRQYILMHDFSGLVLISSFVWASWKQSFINIMGGNIF